MYVGRFCCCDCSLMCYWIVDGFFFFKQKTAYEMRISDWSSDVCSSDLILEALAGLELRLGRGLDRHRFTGARVAARRCFPLCNREGSEADQAKIGRASCRERVCQYV